MNAPNQTSRPLVSVLTSCYNHEPYIDNYCRGLLAQTYDNIELIFFDDGSTDGSWERVRHYEADLRRKFPSVILERHANLGSQPELVLGLQRASGELLCLLESDDYYLPRKIEENVRYLVAHPDVGAVHSDCDFMYGRRLERRHWRAMGWQIPTGDVFDALLVDNFIMTCTFCCRTALFRQHVKSDEYVKRGYIAHDYALYLDLARHTRFGYIDEPLARYRIRIGSHSHPTTLEAAYRFHLMYQQIRSDYIDRYGASEAIRSLALERKQAGLFFYGFRMGKTDQCVSAFAWLREHHPERYRGLVYRVMAAVVRRPRLWRLANRIASSAAILNRADRLFVRRNRGPGDATRRASGRADL